MRWRPGSSGGNVEDIRGRRGGIPLAIGGGGGAIGLIIFVLVNLLGGSGGFNVPTGLDGFPQAQGARGAPLDGAPDPDRQLVQFVEFVLDDVQAFWTREFAAAGERYQEAKLVVFTDAVRSGCGGASAQMGPFYCPLDRKAYLDLAFFRDLASRFRAPGDFAQAYVIAHEIAHHVQNLLGTSGRVRELQQEDPDDANELSVRLELQADCLAGVWAHSTYQRGLLEEGDLEEGLAAAEAVGDDRLQREATGRVSPDSFTHGTSEQRMRWFRRGFDTGDPNNCDTFSR